MGRLNRDEVALFYEEAGEEKLPVLLVHGWCCDHSYFALAAYLSCLPDRSLADNHLSPSGHRMTCVCSFGDR
jgi:hypothetical protein